MERFDKIESLRLELETQAANNELLLKKNKRFRKLAIIFMITTFLFLASTGLIVFLNYDYLVLKVLIAGNYAYTDSLDKLYEQEIGETDVKNYYKYFDNVVISAFTEKLREIDNDNYTYLYTPTQYSLTRETNKTIAKEAEITEIDTNWVYVRIPNISVYTRDFIFENKKMLNAYDNIIIDLQSNYGGDLNALYEIEDLFLEKGRVIGREVARTSFFTKTFKASKDKFFDFDNIVFLQNNNTASAAEGFIMAIRENLPNVLAVGTQSYGKGIGQITIPLKSGFAVKATVIRIETPLENSIHQVGITPDIVHENEEDIVEFVVSHFDDE